MDSAEIASRRPVVVVGVGLTTPRMLRMIVRGDLSDWPEPGPAAQIELLLPDTPVGPVVRTYTVRGWDRKLGEVMIDMSLNDGHGPATQWACRAVVGMRLEISGESRTTFEPATEGGSYVFAGDESALPAIATCLASLPSSAKAVAVVEVANAEEREEFVSHAETRVRWLYRTLSGPKHTFAKAVTNEVAATQPSAVWLASSTEVVSSVKSCLLGSGYPAAQLNAWEYWGREAQASHEPHQGASRAANAALSQQL